MLETLAGRLKWERTDDGIRVEIPGPRNPKAIQYALLMACAFPSGVFVVASFSYWLGLTRSPATVLEIVFTFGLVSATIKLIGMFRSKTILTLSPSQMKIESRFSVQGWETSFFKTASVKCLQFINYSSGAVIQYSGGAGRRNDLRQNEILFVHGAVVFTFGAGITKQEADALLALMTEVYPFPKSSPCA